MTELIERYISVINRDEEQILQRWSTHASVAAMLTRFGIPPSFFLRYFGTKMVSNCVRSIQGSGSERRYPIMYAFMLFFHLRHISQAEMALLYSTLRREFIRPLVHDATFAPLFDRINDAFDLNIEYIFEEVNAIRKEPYAEARALTCKCATVSGLETLQLRDVVKRIEVRFDLDHLEDLQENEGILLDTIDSATSITVDLIEKMATLFEQYAKFLQEDVAFMKLSDAFSFTARTISAATHLEYSDETFAMIKEYLAILCDELSHWRAALIEGNMIEDNKSLISNLEFFAQLFVSQETASVEEAEMEWF